MIQPAQPPLPVGAGKRRRITLKDIAREAGLSIASVSMALRNSPDLAAETVARVKQIAEQLKYAPDPALAALAAYRSRVRPSREMGTIAFITNWSTRNGWTRHREPGMIVKAIKARCEELGYTFEHFWAPGCGRSPRRLDQILQTRGIKGIILAPEGDLAQPVELDWDRYSVISITRPNDSRPFQYVCVAHFHAIMSCWEQLAARGYSRVGLVIDPTCNPKWRHQWNAPHEQAQHDHGITVGQIPPLAVTGENAVQTIRAWLRKHRPDAVICRNQSFAEAAQAEGLSIPQDLGYVSLNVDDDFPGASGIRQPCEEIGHECVDNLHWQLIRNRRGQRTCAVGIEVSGLWVDGTTLPVKARANRTTSRVTAAA